jgi:hypothetical protein
MKISSFKVLAKLYLENINTNYFCKNILNASHKNALES